MKHSTFWTITLGAVTGFFGASSLFIALI